MSPDQLYRWAFAAIFGTVMCISVYYRRRARRTGETIPRINEGPAVLGLRLLVAAPLFLSVIAYMLNPAWMSWSAIDLPDWVRAFGIVCGLATAPFMYWVFSSLGTNVSETVLTKEQHTLVTHGPYRWVRHPLYTGATLWFVFLGLVAANIFILAIAAIAFSAIATWVVPREERELIDKFGQAYVEYIKGTGRFLPRFRSLD